MSDFFGDQGWDGSLDDADIATAVEEAAPAAEADAAVEEPAVQEAQEETPEAVASERERDEQGRFLPKKIEVDDPEVISFLDKYQGDPVKALKAAAEEQRTRGSLNHELGQLRQAIEQQQAQYVQPQAVTPETPVTQELIDSNPMLATQLAYQQGSPMFGAAFEEWEAARPAQAAAWWANTKIEENNRVWEERFTQIQQQYQPLAESQENQAFARELHALGPDAINQIQEGVQGLDPAVASTIMSLLDNGTQDQKIGALKALTALTTQGRAPSVTPDDVRNLARETALAADQAIAEAAVVSATATRSEPAGKSAADLIGEEWDALERPHADGWQVG